MGARTRVSAVAALALAVCAAGCGTAATGSQRPSRAARPWAARAFMHREIARFALLRTRAEGLPPRTRRDWTPPVPGMALGRAQRIPVVVAGGYWLVPGDRYMCIVAEIPASPGVGSVCAPAARAFAHGFAYVSIATAGGGTQRLAVGVAPDGARRVLVHTHGSVTVRPVVGGLFVLRDATAAPPDLLTLRRGP